MRIPRALTIAGSDPSGGAGIQADLKTFSALRVYAVSAVTALTSQNTLGINGIIEIDAEFVSLQIRSVVLDIGVDVVKTGMLCNAGIISRICEDLKDLGIQRIVVDPVMVAKSGVRLMREDAVEALVSQLFPMSLVITPNLEEAEALTGTKVESTEDMKRAAKRLKLLGPGHVVIKGGHLAGNPIDLLYDGRDFREFPGPKFETTHTHGTGCAFASAIAAFIARGATVEDAVGGAKAFITAAIAGGLALGRGHGPIHHFHKFYGFE
ncbi:MAG TPA: bifunctional hydroxymethylpyrimidine kinase/phosphomethylpyrimidine kinase [Syntrophobacteraceae bacterium]|nr:bifunctional hydroxymethylpyrimidine kinase/phosphomethylpyrimidine kinase [Syntrophobacteraceae bacterium]